MYKHFSILIVYCIYMTWHVYNTIILTIFKTSRHKLMINLSLNF